jgi:hypothetical protein
MEAFKPIPDIDPQRLLANLPRDLQPRLQLLLPLRARSQYTDGLVWIPATPEDDPDDNILRPVTNRPWEWLDSVAPEDESGPTANPTSIPLSFFNGRATNVQVLSESEVGDHGWNSPPPRPADLIMQQDSSMGMNIFEADWRLSRMGRKRDPDADNAEHDDEADAHAVGGDGSHDQSMEQVFPESSPAPTVLSRTSAAMSGSSRRGSPAVQVGRGSIDPSSSRTSTKRKAAAPASASTNNSSAFDAEDSDMHAPAAKRGRGRAVSGKTTAQPRGRGKKK